MMAAAYLETVPPPRKLRECMGYSQMRHRGTSLMINRHPLGPYNRSMSRALWGSYGGGRFLMIEVPLYAWSKEARSHLQAVCVLIFERSTLSRDLAREVIWNPDSASNTSSLHFSYAIGAQSTRNALQGYLAYKKSHPLGPYRRPMPRVLGWS